MIERLNERITIQKQTAAADQWGNHINTWTDYFTCSAYCATYPSKFKQDEDGTEVSMQDYRGFTFQVRYCSELRGITSTNYRVKFHDEIYNIEYVDMMNWQRKSIKLKCLKAER
jgi:SPP1 family predicted phage head-tail adaptor